jgi:hypothetical protein
MPIPGNNINKTSNGYEVSRLLTAAVINTKFRTLLLSDPARALATGFNGETFRFTIEEHDRILSIKAHSLADFANQLTERCSPKTYHKPAHLVVDRRVLLPIGID